MTVKAKLPESVRIMNSAMAAEIRAVAARKSITQAMVIARIGKESGVKIEQSYFSRRWRGTLAWSAAEMKIVSDILDEDVMRVYAAGVLAVEERRKTNPCLSDSDTIGSESIGIWARRGYQMGLRLFASCEPELEFDADLTPA